MEDPWGSPWATHDVENNANGIPAITNTKPEPPPPALLSSTPYNNNNNTNSHPAQAPWQEDDAFGDWTTSDLTPVSPGQGWSVWGSTEALPVDGGHLTPNYDGKRKESNKNHQWPSSRSTSPGLRSGSLSKKFSSDHLSHDPWASEASSRDIDGRDAPSPMSHIQYLPALPSPVASEHIPTDFALAETTNDAAAVPSSVVNGAPSTQEPSKNDPLSVGDGGANIASASFEQSLEASSKGPLQAPVPAAEVTIESEAEPSTIPTQKGSVEDQQAAGRKASKVHQLVEMFDGFARKSSVSPRLRPITKPTLNQKGSSTDISFLAADDSNLHNAPDDQTISTPNSPDGMSIDDLSWPPSPRTSGDMDTEPGQEEPDIKPSRMGRGPGIQFDIDFSNMERLFSSPKSLVTGSDVVVPDSIISDSFDSISERKAWYRISRYGPPRKHDAGGDDYICVDWLSSIVRSDTLQIVRRWMEEDSFVGRSFRTGPGNAAGVHAFGWGQSAEPVDLGKFFAQRKPSTSDASSQSAMRHTGSLPAPGPPSLPTPSVAESVSHHHPVAISPSRAAFGIPPGQESPALTSSSGGDWKSSQQARVGNWPGNDANLEHVSGNVDVDDDDWGDMVVSEQQPQSDMDMETVGHDSVKSPTDDVAGGPAITPSTSIADIGVKVELDSGVTRLRTTSPTITRSGDELILDSAFTTPSSLAVVADPPQPSSNTLNSKSIFPAENSKEEDIVTKLISGLPNLSYMLR